MRCDQTSKILPDMNLRSRKGSAITAASAAVTSFSGLAIGSFLLGMFQATIANTCVALTQVYYRRREQVRSPMGRLCTLRVCLMYHPGLQSFRTTYWQIANSSAGIIGPLLSYGMAHAAPISGLHQYQAISICIVSIPPFVRKDSLVLRIKSDLTGYYRTFQYTFGDVNATQ